MGCKIVVAFHGVNIGSWGLFLVHFTPRDPISDAQISEVWRHSWNKYLLHVVCYLFFSF